MNKRLFLAALSVSVSFCAFSEQLDHWLYDATAKTITDNVWTFAATVSSANLTVGACVEGTGFPAELSTLDLSKPVKDASDNVYTIVKLDTLFGKTNDNWKQDSVSTETGLTLGEVILPPVGLTSLGNGTFGGCSALTNVVNFLPDSVTTVGQAVFYGSKVRCDLYAYGVTSFDRCAFTGVPITSVHFGKNLTSIGNGSNKQGAFQSCSSLTNVVFHPESKGINIMKCGISASTSRSCPLVLYGVVAIGDNGFEGVKASEVVFDKCISSISSTDAFKNCQFTKVSFMGPPPKAWNVSYSGINTKVTTYVPAAYRDLWAPLTAGGSIPDDGETTFSAEVCSAAGISDVSKRPVRLIPGSLPVEIFTAADFVAQMAANSNGWFVLKDNIDLTESGYVTVSRFGGVLDGEGHTLSGVGAQPLFDAVCGTIRNLTLDGTVGGNNTTIGFAAAENRGVLCNTLLWGEISDVRVKGYTVKAPSFAKTSWVGLIAGRVYNESDFVRCETEAGAELFGSNNGYGGGFAGIIRVSGTAEHGPSFYSCTNHAACAYSQDVYSGGGLGGIVGNIASVTAPCVISNCYNDGKVSSSYKCAVLGGIFGTGGAAAGNDGKMLVAGCENVGEVTATASSGGFYLGGIGGQSTSCIVLSNCVNRAVISTASKDSYCGGLCNHRHNGEIGKDMIQRYYNCANYGDITATVQAGGFSAGSRSNDDYSGTGVYYKNCANYGTISSEITDEFIPAGTEAKNRKYYARSNRTVENSFAMSRHIEYFNEVHPADKWWFTVTDCVTAGDEGYSASAAASTLNAGAAALGLSKWRVTERGVPELVSIVGDVVSNIGLTILFR